MKVVLLFFLLSSSLIACPVSKEEAKEVVEVLKMVKWHLDFFKPTKLVGIPRPHNYNKVKDLLEKWQKKLDECP